MPELAKNVFGLVGTNLTFRKYLLSPMVLRESTMSYP